VSSELADFRMPEILGGLGSLLLQKSSCPVCWSITGLVGILVAASKTPCIHT
jgi:hypothetical protein